MNWHVSSSCLRLDRFENNWPCRLDPADIVMRENKRTSMRPQTVDNSGLAAGLRGFRALPFGTSMDMVYPLSEHSAVRQGRCPMCGKTMLIKTLSRHIRAMHGSGYPACPLCEKICRRKDTLDRHMAEKHGEKAGVFGTVECAVCGKSVRERALRDHFRSRACVEARAKCSSVADVQTRIEISIRFDASTVLEPLDVIAEFFPPSTTNTFTLTLRYLQSCGSSEGWRCGP